METQKNYASYCTLHIQISNRFDLFVLPEFFGCAWDLSEVNEGPDAVQICRDYDAPKLIEWRIERKFKSVFVCEDYRYRSWMSFMQILVDRIVRSQTR